MARCEIILDHVIVEPTVIAGQVAAVVNSAQANPAKNNDDEQPIATTAESGVHHDADNDSIITLSDSD